MRPGRVPYFERLGPLLLAGLAGLAVCGSLGAASADRSQTQAQLRALKQRIEQVSRDVGRDAVERDRLARNLRSAELAVAATRSDLETLQAKEKAHADQRATLGAERARISASLAAERASLGAQLRLAYRMGPHEPLQLLLNQRDPAAAQRLYAWYGYFGRARAVQIAGIQQQVQRIDQLDAELAAEARSLAQLREDRAQRLAQLETGRAQRASALENLQAEARSRAASLARLREQQASLERLLRELARAAPSQPRADDRSEFGRLRGRLEWPVAGRIVASYGDTRASGVDWNGVVVATERAAPVRAIAAGRVIYADWLPGLGLLTIVDHGGGYLSLYGYNDQLRKSVGEAVGAGDVIAAAGDTGGRPEPQLYLEIRRAGKPIDPQPWFRQRRP
ncbi:MAG TPA: peptidoglycan DD-metalloendopeptidase family protein [Steroidobacteraceae bacterium]|nr:peptidoglycan DD-metalloendopeptidase family protein [Steroidobacteraceae bacterium]